jgi:hypothetical protein
MIADLLVLQAAAAYELRWRGPALRRSPDVTVPSITQASRREGSRSEWERAVVF